MSIRPEDHPMLALSLQATVLSHARMREAAMAFASEIASARGCVRVSVGFVVNHFITLVAVSHGGDEGLGGKAFAGLAAAMDEAVAQGTSVQFPAEGAPAVRLAHSRLATGLVGAVASVPIVYMGETVGAVTCEWATRPPAMPLLVSELENLVSLAGPVLYLMQQREAPLRRRLAEALRRTGRKLRSSEGARARIAVAAAVVAVVVALALPVEYRVGGHAQVQGEQQRSLVAPADGFLKASHVRPGDHVKAGQLLIEMADQDLSLQRRKWASDLSLQENAYASALARADRAAMVIALARADEARAHLELVEAELSRSRILAPFDGIVVDGDLSQLLGAPVERGKPLIVMAPLERYRVVVQVDERDIASVQTGQQGTLALSALPWDALPIRVTRITPVARAVESRNVFDVETDIQTDASRIRPGLEGVAKIAVGQAPLAWVWSHRLIDWLRLSA
ncbi:efflux RND transporter periplasmic adaptor subunit, partial [Variovorax sp. HJSM1_2]|uniref:efflux RND transporter periplasmic adaptor subunit n=1 Tax=Variovorax sp. HJSM1_2 TaxID=3366263 RepID=UPI003BC5E9D7